MACVKIEYALIDGVHCFSSSNPLAKGLCVACAHPKDAFDEVTAQLKHLIPHNSGRQINGVH